MFLYFQPGDRKRKPPNRYSDEEDDSDCCNQDEIGIRVEDPSATGAGSQGGDIGEVSLGVGSGDRSSLPTSQFGTQSSYGNSNLREVVPGAGLSALQHPFVASNLGSKSGLSGNDLGEVTWGLGSVLKHTCYPHCWPHSLPFWVTTLGKFPRGQG